jgi:hypothetical protein
MAQVTLPPEEEKTGPVTRGVLGSENYPCLPDMTDITYMIGRIDFLTGVENCPLLERLCLR